MDLGASLAVHFVLTFVCGVTFRSKLSLLRVAAWVARLQGTPVSAQPFSTPWRGLQGSAPSAGCAVLAFAQQGFRRVYPKSLSSGMSSPLTCPCFSSCWPAVVTFAHECFGSPTMCWMEGQPHGCTSDPVSLFLSRMKSSLL